MSNPSVPPVVPQEAILTPEQRQIDPRTAFVEGAKWWEFTSSGGTMWASDQARVVAEAESRYPGGEWPPAYIELLIKLRVLERERDELKAQIGEAREACPIVRRQDYFDASLLTVVNETVSQLFQWQSWAQEAIRERDDARAALRLMRNAIKS